MSLTPDEMALLREISGGADVFSRKTAKQLRALAKKAPRLMRITEAMGEYPGATRQPFFGAVCTTEGRALLA